MIDADQSGGQEREREQQHVDPDAIPRVHGAKKLSGQHLPGSHVEGNPRYTGRVEAERGR
jgi:hypothetical protein